MAFPAILRAFVTLVALGFASANDGDSRELIDSHENPVFIVSTHFQLLFARIAPPSPIAKLSASDSLTFLGVWLYVRKEKQAYSQQMGPKRSANRFSRIICDLPNSANDSRE